MKRLTKRDWWVINAALAHYEAEPWKEVGGWSTAREEANYKAVGETRTKVHQRLDRYRDAYDDPFEHLDVEEPDEEDEDDD